MSAFDRLPSSYRALCQRIADAWRTPRKHLSIQNSRVRFAADMYLANGKTFTHRDTRQHCRAASKPWKQR